MPEERCPGGCQLIDIVMGIRGYYCTSCGEAVPMSAVMDHADVPKLRDNVEGDNARK